MSERIIKYSEAIQEAQAECLRADPSVFLIGLGVPGPTGIFGTTRGLVDEFGPDRVMDMPASEGGMTGVVLGAAVSGFRPIMVHMRVDFAVLSMETLVNQAAKWHYMYGGKMRAPLVVRMIIGRGWGQGPQHSQSLQAWFAHVPGLKVVMPATAADAKGMLVSAVYDDAPVIIFEHRWLYSVTGPVSPGLARTPLEGARVMRSGRDVTLAGFSYMTIENMRAAEMLQEVGIDAEVVDLRSLTPIDYETVGESVRKTGRLVASDTAHTDFGATAEVVAGVVERCFASLKKAPVRIGLPFIPTPTTPALADLYYPRAIDIARAALKLCDSTREIADLPAKTPWRDVPDSTFTGPY
ncbi:alpha-ketoacid dehydrogenase subunit beta [Aurantimonas sp. MSK8Z-1]|uniref:alpha-ketoacid dehydrogenase subunit beta n=1 Tax=Mangrovibrevibacter kandeliae TaxID=2968473 RepID=UPI00211881F9|nr:transketolase C-terminal domain-containing protein [Aurantimonas sp. MSK8Z-1]MCW4117006.1 alpha-ketoacid dehydrogenase subunit beta [Aurantimonas sp. MSK8Z-1]